MMELSTRLVPLLLVDVINPVLFALLLSALNSQRPLANGLALIAGHTVAYFLVGVAAAVGLQQITERLENPHPVDFVLSAFIGVLCLWAALKSRGGGASEEKQTGNAVTPLQAFGIGAVVNFVGAPFAVPYFAAIDQLLKADLSAVAAVAVLLGYNLLYALPFILVALVKVATGERFVPLLKRVDAVLVAIANLLLPLILVLLGVALLADAGLFFWRGQGLL